MQTGQSADSQTPVENRRALVLGAGGKAGGEAVRLLLAANWQVIGVDRRFPIKWEVVQCHSQYRMFMGEAVDWNPSNHGIKFTPSLVVVATKAHLPNDAIETVRCEALVVADAIRHLVDDGGLVVLRDSNEDFHRRALVVAAANLAIDCRVNNGGGGVTARFCPIERFWKYI